MADHGKSGSDASQDAVDILEQYLPVLSHDTRSPMTAIKGAVGLLQQEFPGPVNENQQQLLGICMRNADLATYLVQDVVDLLRLNAGLAKYHASELNVLDVVAEVRRQFTTPTNLELRVEADGERIPLIADRTSMRRMLNAMIRLPHQYPQVTDVVLRISPAAEGAVFTLTLGPLDTDPETLRTELVRSVRQSDQRLTATGLEMRILLASAEMLETELGIESVDGGVRVTLLWPTQPLPE